MREIVHSPAARPPSSLNLRISTAALIASNLVPLAGVLFFGWKVSIIMILFWFENVIIGVFNVLKMLLAEPGEPQGTMKVMPTRVETVALKLFLVPFFIVHYGLFTAVHGVFVFAFFGPGRVLERKVDVSLIQSFDYSSLVFPALALVVSHGVSFFSNYIFGGERERVGIKDLMAQPYKRIVVLHLTILIGAILAVKFESSVAPLVFLVALKTCVDLVAHQAEHREAGTGGIWPKGGGRIRAEDNRVE